MKRRRRRDPPAGYATVALLAERGDAARSSIYDAIKRGDLPAFRHRGVLVVREADYDRAFLAITPVETGASARND